MISFPAGLCYTGKKISGCSAKAAAGKLLTKEEWKEIENYIEKLEIENGYVQELGEHEEEYVPKWDI